MKRTLLLLMALLCIGGSGAWAQTVSVKLNDPTTNPTAPYTYGTRSNSNKTFTTNAASGLAGVVFNVTGFFDGYSSGDYSGRNAVRVSAANADETFTLSVPDGFTLTGYSFSAKCVGDYTYTITAGGTAYSITNSDYTTVEVTGLNATTASFTVKGSKADWVAVGPFTVTVEPKLEDGTNYIVFSPTTFANGTLTRNSDSMGTSSWGNTWTHANTAIVISESNTNNYYIDKDGVELAGGDTYKITAPASKLITGYVITGKAKEVSDYNTFTITPNGGSAVSFNSSTASSVSVTGLATTSTSFTLGNNVKQRLISYSITIYYVDNSDYLPLSSLSNGMKYTLKSGRGTMGVADAVLANTAKSGVSASDFAIIQYNGDYHLYSVADSKFISNTGAEADAPSFATKVMIEGNPYVYNNKGYNYRFRYQNKYVNTGSGQTTGAVIDTWGSDSWGFPDDGNEFNILPDGDFTLTDAISEALATAYTPFTISTDEEKTWYYIGVRNRYLTYDSENSAFGLLESKQFVESAQWAFIGDPVNGFKILNRATGSYLAYETATMKISETPTLWKTGLHPAKDGYRLTTGGGEGNNLYCGTSGGINLTIITGALTYKNDYADTTDGVPGGAFSFEEVPDYTEEAQQYLAYVDQNVGNYFALTSDANTTLKEYVGKSISADDLQTIYDTWTAGMQYPADGGYYRIKSNRGNYIGYGQSVLQYDGASATGLISVSSSSISTDASTVFKLTLVDASTHTYKLSTQGFNVQAQTTRDTAFPATTSEGVNFIFSNVAPGVVSITNVASQVDGNYAGSLHEASDGWSVAAIVNWNSSSDASHWTVEDAEGDTFNVPLNEVAGKYYATMYLPFPVTLPTISAANAVFPSYVTISGTRAKLNTTSERVVPAGKPVLLYGEGCGTTLSVTIGGEENTTFDVNALQGTYVDKTELADNEYIFGTSDGELGFWKLGEGKKVGANKAYLVYDGTPASAKGFALDFDTATGISAMDNGQWAIAAGETPAYQMYNLAGQRVGQASRLRSGIYIVNGKKVVVK